MQELRAGRPGGEVSARGGRGGQAGPPHTRWSQVGVLTSSPSGMIYSGSGYVFLRVTDSDTTPVILKLSRKFEQCRALMTDAGFLKIESVKSLIGFKSS